MKVAILTSPNQWFEIYAQELAEQLKGARIYASHKDINKNYNVLFILSYHRLIEKKILDRNKHNLVIHGSDLPKGKGWAPLFWQVIEGINEVTFSMFEAAEGMDNGDIYLQRKLTLTGYELNAELRHKQAELTIEMCLEFIKNYKTYSNPKKQEGSETFYRKRTREDSMLDVNQTILEQFNLLRTVNNENYPAFFEIDGNKFYIKIESD